METAGPADCIFYGANIVTMDEECPCAQALATKDGKIVAVGDKNNILNLGGASTKYIALENNQTLLPGFIEAHQHAVLMAMSRCLFTDCSGYYYKSYQEVKNCIDNTIANVPRDTNKWCLFVGWDPELIPDLPELNWKILDTFSRDVPVVIIGQNFHIGWANRRAFEMANVREDTPDPNGGIFERDPETKELTGKLLEPAAYFKVIDCAPAASYKEWAKAVDDQWTQYAHCGFTTVTELLFRHNSWDHLDEAIESKTQQPDCPLRLAIYEYVDSVEETAAGESSSERESPSAGESPSKKNKKQVLTSENDKLWFAGVKIIMDGSPHCGTVAIREPFLENDLTKMLGFPPSPNYGLLNFSKEKLTKMVKFWHDKGKQVAIHTHGERAIELVLDVYEEVF